MVCLPASQFCCGCSVTFGVKTILLLNLLMNVLIIAKCVAHLIYRMKEQAFASYPTECAVLGFFMAGVPIIVMAFSGVCHRNEAQVRMYLFYMWAALIILTANIMWQFVFSGACSGGLSLAVQFPGAGEAWLCGVVRWIHIAVVVVSLSTFGYLQHVVYSYCEDLTECGGGPDLSDLVLNKEHYSNKMHRSAYSSFEALAEVGEGAPSGFGGGSALFGGQYHKPWQSVQSNTV